MILAGALPVALCLAMLYVPRMFAGFFIDETGTHWMACGGAVEALRRTSAWPGQSLLFSAIQSGFCTDDPYWREAVFRIPAFTGTVACTAALFRFVANFASPIVAGAACSLFLIHPVVLEVGAQARPYSLATAAAILSTVYFLRWMNRDDSRARWGFVASTAAMLYFHYLFASLIAVQALVLLGVRPASRKGAGADFAKCLLVICLALVPLAGHAASLYLSQDYRTVSSAVAVAALRPNLDRLVRIAVPATLYIQAIIALVAWILHSESDTTRPPRGTALFAGILGVMVPLGYFAVARWLGAPIWQARYVSVAVPGVALGLALAIRHARLYWSAAIIVFNLLVAVAFSVAPEKVRSAGYRGAIESIRSKDPEGRSLIVLKTPLWESPTLNWSDQSRLSNRLFAPLTAYGVVNPATVVPNAATQDVAEHLSRSIKGYEQSWFVIFDRSQASEELKSLIKGWGYLLEPLAIGAYPTYRATKSTPSAASPSTPP